MPTLGENIRGAVSGAQPSDPDAMILMAIMQVLAQAGAGVKEYFETRRSLERYGWEKEDRERELAVNDWIVEIQANRANMKDVPAKLRPWVRKGLAGTEAEPRMHVAAKVGEAASLFGSKAPGIKDETIRRDTLEATARTIEGDLSIIAQQIDEQNPDWESKVAEWKNAFGNILQAKNPMMQTYITDAMHEAIELSHAGEKPGIQNPWTPEAAKAMEGSPNPLTKAIYFTLQSNPEWQKSASRSVFETVLTDEQTKALQQKYPNTWAENLGELQVGAMTGEELLNLIKTEKLKGAIPEPKKIDTGLTIGEQPVTGGVPFGGPPLSRGKAKVEKWINPEIDQLRDVFEPYSQKSEAEAARDKFVVEHPDMFRESTLKALIDAQKEKAKTATAAHSYQW